MEPRVGIRLPAAEFQPQTAVIGHAAVQLLDDIFHDAVFFLNVCGR